MAAERIHALMITGKSPGHRALAVRSVESFLAQTYPDKQLIVVNDGDYRLSEEFGNRITEIMVNEKMPLGALRNLSLDAVPQDALWLQWDDDDWRHPELMTRQYAALMTQQADACVLKSQVQYAVAKNSAWIERRAYIEGTLLARKTEHRYRNLRKGEDTYFLRDYHEQRRVVAWENPSHYYIRLIHGRNTWDAAHFKLETRIADHWSIGEAARAYLQTVLIRYSFSDY